MYFLILIVHVNHSKMTRNDERSIRKRKILKNMNAHYNNNNNNNNNTKQTIFFILFLLFFVSAR